MGIGTAITLVSCLAGTMLALPALLMFLNILFARTTHRSALRLQRGFIVPFFVGLVPTLALGIPSTILLSLGSIFQFCGTIAYLLLFLWAFTGLAAVGQALGMRLLEMSNRPENLTQEAGIGIFLLTFAIAFPIIGWFIILPFSIVIGVGANVMAVFKHWFGQTAVAPAIPNPM
jgi:hypothetical protein